MWHKALAVPRDLIDPVFTQGAASRSGGQTKVCRYQSRKTQANLFAVFARPRGNRDGQVFFQEFSRFGAGYILEGPLDTVIFGGPAAHGGVYGQEFGLDG
jgi:hypothetical protein